MLDTRYTAGEEVTLVCDNLNTQVMYLQLAGNSSRLKTW
jgi:hypothetical protein